MEEENPYEKGTGKYQRLYDHISYNYERYLDENELERIIHYAENAKKENQNIGLRVERIEHNDREKAFHDEWIKENLMIPGIDYGNGILQDLFIDKGLEPLTNAKWHLEVTRRERMIVATVIQWLGSNCGMSFLGQALKRCGYKIVKDEA